MTHEGIDWDLMGYPVVSVTGKLTVNRACSSAFSESMIGLGSGEFGEAGSKPLSFLLCSRNRAKAR